MITCKECNKEFETEEALQHHRNAKHDTKHDIEQSKKIMSFYKKYLWYALFFIALLALGFWAYSSSTAPGKYDAFAQCLTENGAVFYGAFWCPHCQNQKALFGKSKDLLPYVECSTADGKEQLPICEEKNIEGYPTWDFADSTRLTGEISLETLAEKTGCTLPE